MTRFDNDKQYEQFVETLAKNADERGGDVSAIHIAEHAIVMAERVGNEMALRFNPGPYLTKDDDIHAERVYPKDIIRASGTNNCPRIENPTVREMAVEILANDIQNKRNELKIEQ